MTIPARQPSLRHTITWPYEQTRREELAVWTAPAGGRCGQLCALYEARRGGGRGAWVAVGRLVTDAVRAVEGDGKTWAWIQWRRLARPVAWNDSRLAGIRSVQGSYGELTTAQWRRLSALLVKPDPVTRGKVARWAAGLGLPTVDRVPYSALATATLETPPHERELYPVVEAALSRERWKPLPDDLRAVITSLRGGTPTDPDGDHRRAPDVAVCHPKDRRVLLVEVKWRAVPALGDFHPVDQVLSYVAAALSALHGTPYAGWTVEPLLVAEDFTPDVVEAAANARVPGAGPGIPCRLLVDDELRKP